MTKPPLACVYLLVLCCSACTQDMSQPNNRRATGPAFTLGPSAVSATTSVPLNFRAHLTGDEVVPPRETRAQGEAVLQLSADGAELSYVVIASNIENVTAAHIHLSALIDAIQAGNAYVDVPTNDGVAPAFTGPGDFVTGEIRGQLR